MTRAPRTVCPASVTHAVRRANVRFPRFWRRAFSASRTGSRTNDVLCAVLATFGVAVPGVYGTNDAFHAYAPRVFGVVNTDRTVKTAITSEALDGAPCGGST